MEEFDGRQVETWTTTTPSSAGGRRQYRRLRMCQRPVVVASHSDIHHNPHHLPPMSREQRVHRHLDPLLQQPNCTRERIGLAAARDLEQTLHVLRQEP